MYLFCRQVAGKYGTCHRVGYGHTFILFNDFIYKNIAGKYAELM